MTVGAPRVADEVAAVLVEAGIKSSRLEARWIVEAATREEAGSGTAGHALAMARRRAGGEPLQYVTGVAGFRMLELAVGPGVLVPRPETELVAGEALALLPHGGLVVDVGTGSGAIALSLKAERPDATVLATELSLTALRWAELNRSRLGLDVALLRGDLLGPVPARLAGRVDVVVSNPPYVGTAERDSLPPEVAEHEPAEALFAGLDGLAVIGRLAAEARGWLAPGGHLVTEIGAAQGDAVRRLLTGAGYTGVDILPDLAARDRVAVAASG